MKIKKTQISFFPSLLLCVFFLLTLSFCTKAESPKKDYGVFLGMNGNTGIKGKDEENLQRLKSYRMVVLEPSNFSPEQIREIKAEGTKVYGYLNIGALENFRPYYEDFKKDSEKYFSMDNVKIIGFMTMAPLGASEEEISKYFSKMLDLKRKYAEKYELENKIFQLDFTTLYYWNTQNTKKYLGKSYSIDDLRHSIALEIYVKCGKEEEAVEYLRVKNIYILRQYYRRAGYQYFND